MKYDMVIDTFESARTVDVVETVVIEIIGLTEGTLLYSDALTAFAGYVLANSCYGELPA